MAPREVREGAQGCVCPQNSNSPLFTGAQGAIKVGPPGPRLSSELGRGTRQLFRAQCSGPRVLAPGAGGSALWGGGGGSSPPSLKPGYSMCRLKLWWLLPQPSHHAGVTPQPHSPIPNLDTGLGVPGE